MHLSKVDCIKTHFGLRKYLTSSQTAMFFPTLLIAPTSLFTNALPADGPISSRDPPIQARAVVSKLEACTSTDGVRPQAFILTLNQCFSFATAVGLPGYLSGSSGNKNIDTDKNDCIISLYRGLKCFGSPIGVTPTIVSGPEIGPCVDFNPLPQIPPPPTSDPSNPLNVQGAYSAELTCKPTSTTIRK